MELTERMEECPRCGRQRRPNPLDKPGCSHCREFARKITNGLRWCRLDLLPNSTPWRDYTLLAIICGIKISRGHSYWIAKGNVPLALAWKLYEDPAGRDLIRVAGHCECPPPESPWVSWWMPDGREVLSLANKASATKGAASAIKSYADICRKILAENLFSDDPAKLGASGYVTSYHIDGDLGLRVFVDALREREGD
jgi:hypothetical protein